MAKALKVPIRLLVYIKDVFPSLNIDLPQVDLMNFRVEFRVEYVRPRSGRASDEVARGRPFVRRVLNKQDEGLFRKSTLNIDFQLSNF